MNRRMRKVLFLIISLFTLFLFVGCDLNIVLPDVEEHTLEYSCSGGGKLECEYESGSKIKSGTVVTVYAKANDGETLLKWTVNGEEKLDRISMTVTMKKDYIITAEFTLFKDDTGNDTGDDVDVVTYDKNTIYAYLPESWKNPEVTLKSNYGDKRDFMTSVQDNLWKVEPSSLGINYTNISGVIFSDGSKRSQEIRFDQDFNVFNYSGNDKNGLLSGSFGLKKADAFKLSVLELNDLHGYIVRSNEGKSGISNASFLINQVRSEDERDNVILVGNGDMFQGTALSNLSQGLTVLKCMNQMNFDFMGIGNHEFDWGIDKIFNYFDGDETNGEATFPLVNSNIINSNSNELLTDENVVPTYMIEKNGIKIGVISMIDDVKSSILYSRVKDFDFVGLRYAREQAISLKEQGADIILANIHGGDTSGVESFSMNQELARLTYNNDWLIDCVVNGHTHTNQSGFIERIGRDLPIVQGGSYCYYLGQIDLYVDMNTKKVFNTNCFTTNTYEANTNYDVNVENVIDTEYLKVKDQMEEVYCVSTADVGSRYDYKEWVANVMIATTGTVCSISNNGGLRSDGEIRNGTNIGLENLYLINPFDNQLVICEVKGSDLYSFLSRNSAIYYGLKGISLSELRYSDAYYKIVVIDYVFYWDTFPSARNVVYTDIVLRDAMIEDLRLRTTFNVYTDTAAKIGLLVQ